MIYATALRVAVETTIARAFNRDTRYRKRSRPGRAGKVAIVGSAVERVDDRNVYGVHLLCTRAYDAHNDDT
jgi:hypothetical protein